MNQYFLYVRKSSEEEDRQILSIDSQIRELTQLAQKEGLNIVEIFKESRSAKDIGRPVFNEMMEKIETGNCGIIAWKLDRLARNELDGGRIIYWLGKGTISKIVTAEKTYEGVNDKFLMQIEFGMATKYVDDLSFNTKRGFRHKLTTKKEWPGLAPIGYINMDGKGVIAGKSYDKHKQRLLEKENKVLKRIEIDPIQGSIIKKIFEEYATGNFNLETMAEKSYQLDLRGKLKNKKVSKSVLARLLRNPFYYGMMVMKNEQYEGNHEPLISKVIFDRIQEVLRQNSRPISQRWQFAFRGIIKCSYCGCSITAEEKKGHVYYHCTQKRGKCAQPYLREEEIEKQLRLKIKEITIGDMVKELLMTAVKKSHNNEKELYLNSIKYWQNIFNKCEDRLDRLLNLYTDGLIEKEEYGKKKREILDAKMEAKEKLEAHDKTNQAWHDYAENLIIQTNHAYKVFEEGSIEDKKALLRAVGKNFILRDGLLNFDLKEPFNFVAELNKTKGSNLTHWQARQDSNLQDRFWRPAV